MTTQGTQNQSIFDIALIAFQDPSRVYELITSGTIENINSEVAGVTFEFTPSKVTQKEVTKTIAPKVKSVILSQDKTAFDVALQYYGGAEFVFDFIRENGLESIESDFTGRTLQYTELNTFVPLYFRKTGKQVATKNSPATVQYQYGIGYDTIQTDLIVY